MKYLLSFFVLAFLSCASLDSFLYNPKRVERYALSYDANVRPERRVPEDLREELSFPAEGGALVYAVMAYRPTTERASAPTILYHHGNKFGIDEYWARVSHLWSLGANVLIYDYPGYGRCEGSPTEEGVYRHARAATAYVRNLGPRIDQSRLFHYGYSLGGGPAIESAKSLGLFRGLIVESTFRSVAALVEDGSLVVPRSFVTANTFDNVGKIREAAAHANVGVLFFHGTADDFVQPKYGQQLFDAVSPDTPRELVLIEGADHGGVPDSPLYDEKLRRFLAK
jgi:fermentation-respiration switch protein FrsA (DUF1100 family)